MNVMNVKPYVGIGLNERKLKVQTKDQLSTPTEIENVVPQGRAPSVSLFLIPISDISHIIYFSQGLFADDFNISVLSSYPHEASVYYRTLSTQSYMEFTQNSHIHLPKKRKTVSPRAFFFFYMANEFPHICASTCLLYTSPSPRDRTRSRMPSSA